MPADLTADDLARLLDAYAEYEDAAAPTSAHDRWAGGPSAAQEAAEEAIAEAAHALARAVIRLEAERDEARAEADRYRLALESLTPGGSEYYRNPERCVEVIREMKQEPARIVARLKGEVDRLRGIIHQVGYSCRECRSDTGAVFLGDDLVASIHAALP